MGIRKQRLLSRREVIKLKIASWTTWWTDDEHHEYRLPILALWCGVIPIIIGQTLLWFNTGWTVWAKAGASFLLGGVCLGLAMLFTYLIREDLG